MIITISVEEKSVMMFAAAQNYFIFTNSLSFFSAGYFCCENRIEPPKGRFFSLSGSI